MHDNNDDNLQDNLEEMKSFTLHIVALKSELSECIHILSSAMASVQLRGHMILEQNQDHMTGVPPGR